MNKTILIIDDDPCHARLAGFSLMQDGFDVITAFNGSDGIEKAKKEKVDLIMLDVKMPDMDGYTVLKHLKSDAEIRHIPVLLFTGYYHQIDRHLAHTLRVAGVLVKPADPSEIVSRARNLLTTKSEQVKEMAIG